MMDVRYFIAADAQPLRWTEVTKADYCRAERAAGFVGKFGPDVPATSSFFGGGTFGQARHDGSIPDGDVLELVDVEAAMPPSRFALSEDPAVLDGFFGPDGPADFVGPDWSARTSDAHAVPQLLDGAAEGGLISGPAGFELEFIYDDDEPPYYLWAVNFPGGDGRLRLGGNWSDLKHLGDGGAYGQDAARSILAEAVQAGNYLLDELDKLRGER